MEWGAAIGGAISLILMILRYALKEKSKVDQAHDIASKSQKKIINVRRKISRGDLMGAVEDMDTLERDIRMLLRMRKAKRDSSR